MRIDRLLAIIIMLINRRRVSARELADYFEVSVRTIYRDIDAINLAGIPVVAFPGNGGGFGIMDSYKVDRQMLSLEDMVSILTALKGINATFQDRQVDTTIEKIQSLVPKEKKAHVEQLYNQVVIDILPWGAGSRQKTKLQLIHQCLAELKLLAFSYRNLKAQTTSRTIEPMTLIFKGFAWYLYGYCRLKKDYRLFRLSRMTELVKKTESFIAKQSSYDDFIRSSKQDPRSFVALVLLFLPEARSRVEDSFDPEQISYLEDGYLKVEVTYPEDEWLYASLLSFGEQLEILRPARIREKIKEKAQKIAEIYEKKKLYSQT